ncbi:hypothetical protein AABB24_025815 [Solanum stoloniferum]|uniref:Cyclin-dependent kinase inhibitor domain-containing protein n=1 Tax=Solanum stoloniferum TaxID=62892 RepID=A0ABD2SCJ7_9SOLN
MGRNCKRIGKVIIMELSDASTTKTKTKKRKILRLNGVVHTPPGNSNCEPAGSSMSCCSTNSKSLDLDANGGEVADKEKKSIEEEFELEKMPPLEEFGELELNEMPPLEVESNDEMPPPPPEIIPTTQEIEEFFTRCELRTCKRLREKYNFDFEKEEPLEGRFEWVKI